MAVPVTTGTRLNAALDEVLTDQPGLRRSPVAGLHLTLLFLGAATERQCDRLGRHFAPRAARLPRPTLVLDQVGAFPDASRPRVLWLAPARLPAAVAAARTAALCSAAAAGCDAPGLQLDRQRTYRPHVTVARVRVSTSVPAAFFELELEKQPWSPVGVTLFESVPAGPGDALPGSRYEPLRTYPFHP